MSNEPTDGASKLFDSIYQGSGDISNLENTSKAGDSLTKLRSNKPQTEDNAGSGNILQDANKIASTTDSFSDRDTNVLTDTKLDQALLNKNTSLPFAHKGLRKSENLSSDAKVGTLSVHLKNASDTADLEQLSALVENIDNDASGATSNLPPERSESTENPVKTGKADILGKINVDGTMVESSLRGNHAWESGGLDRQHEIKNASVLPPANNSALTKLDSVSADNNIDDVMGSETMANEINTQNSILNAPSAEFEKSENKTPNAHTKTSIISKEGKLQNIEPSEELNSPILNPSTSKLENITSSKKLTTQQEGDHVQGIFPKHAAKDEVRDKSVDDHVRLSTASVSFTDNGTSVSSVMGVIRYDDDGNNIASKGEYFKQV